MCRSRWPGQRSVTCLLGAGGWSLHKVAVVHPLLPIAAGRRTNSLGAEVDVVFGTRPGIEGIMARVGRRHNDSLEPTGRPAALPRPERRPGRPAAQFRRYADNFVL